MSRLPYFLFSFVFLVVPAFTAAQTAAPVEDRALFDFESGNFEGWTRTGDCWDKQPATAKTFVDRQGAPLVSGIVGRGYLTTLFKSAATTGRAVSKEFPIDRPFLTFRIGGGCYPEKACVNLLVDGKIVRSETGRDSAELLPAYWDVAPLIGKTAHLEVVDATANPKRGYIMLDAVRLTEAAPLLPQTLLEERGMRPRFLAASRFFENEEQRSKGRYLHFGVTEPQFNHMVDSVWLKMCDKRYEPFPGIAVETIADYAKEAASGAAKQGEKEFVAPLTELGRQWLLAEAVCAWSCFYIQRDTATDQAQERDPSLDTVALASPDVVLKTNPPLAQCAGYALVTRDVARKAGLTASILQGTLRVPLGGGGAHCFTVFEFPGGLTIPADTTTPCARADAQQYGGKIRGYGILPRRREEWELYHAMHYNWTPIPGKTVTFGDSRDSFHLLDLSEAQWKAININDYAELYRKIARTHNP